MERELYGVKDAEQELERLIYEQQQKAAAEAAAKQEYEIFL